MDIDVLKLELTGDSLGRGYSAMTPEEAAASLNVKDQTRDRTSMSGREVLAQVDLDELKALTDDAVQLVFTIGGYPDIDPFGPVEIVFVNFFGTGSKTIAALKVARVETISRGVELGLGLLRTGDIQRARM